MELNITHLQHYPLFGDNGLKVFSNYWSKNKKIGICSISVITNESDNNIGLIGKDKFERYDHIRNIKPLLLPLSALYEEIDGEIGIVELFKMLCTSDEPFESFKTRLMIDYLEVNDDAMFYFEEGAFRYIVDEKIEGFIPCQLALFDYLFSHHYDPCGLIDKGIAIDKRSVK